MRIVECIQGDPVWVESRLGIPTASNFSKIITPKQLKTGGPASITYLNALLSEWLLGIPSDSEHSQLMDRGTELETKAAQLYAIQNDANPEKIGLCLHDTLEVGCSPDRLVGADGLLEIKCPAPTTHIGYLLNGVDAEYRCQVQGQLWITGRQWLDFLSYHPDMPEFQIRVERDAEFISALAEAVEGFLAQLERGKSRLIELGAVPARQEAA